MPTSVAVRQLSIHEVRADDLKVEAVNYNDSRWVSLKIGDFELTMFAPSQEEYQRLKNFFMVEDERDREINEAQFRAMEENVPW